MATRQTRGVTYGEAIKSLEPGQFVTLEKRLPRGGSLQARLLSNGAVQFYWRYTHGGNTQREPIGAYDSKAPPKKMEPGPGGYSVAAALEQCKQLAHTQGLWADRGGLRGKQEAERAAHHVLKAEAVEKVSRTLAKLLQTYVDHLKAQGRSSWYDAKNIFSIHVEGAWPNVASMPAADVTPDHVLDMLRLLIQQGKGRTANKLRSYFRAAYQCAIDVRTTASIPIAFKAFAVTSNPAALTRRDSKYDRADKRPLSTDELRTYWRLLKPVAGAPGATLRLHVLTGGQRIEQFVRLERANVTNISATLFDAKGRPGQQPRPHTIPLLDRAAMEVESLSPEGTFVFSTTKGQKHISPTTLGSWAREAIGEGLPGFQLKRVRSGVETLLAANGIGKDIRGHLQSHGLTGVQARHYDGHDYMREKREALEVLLMELERKSAAKRGVRAKRKG